MRGKEAEAGEGGAGRGQKVRVAVLTLTRDRIAYTRACFQTLRDNAGCDFDWFVLDQASKDGTADWLLAQEDLDVTVLSENIGICKGLNLLLDEACNPADYDAIVRFDNDCEVLRPDTLLTVCSVAVDYDVIVAPKVLGLRNPPAPIAILHCDEHLVEETTTLGGIFMVMPARLFSEKGYRYDEAHPAWTGDEQVCSWWRQRGGSCGYLQGWAVNHYLTTDGQQADDPGYWDRKTREMAA